MLSAALLLAAVAAPARADEPPVALAGVPFLAYPGERIVLDGSASYDPDGASLTWAWTQVHGPGVDLRADTTANPEFDAELPGTYTFELVVDDGLLQSEPDEVDVIVVDPAIGMDMQPQGCQAAPAAGGLLLLLPALVGRRRQAR